MTPGRARVRLVFVENGSYHHEEVTVGTDALEAHERLIDALREDPGILKEIFVDVNRLCAAYLVEEESEVG